MFYQVIAQDEYNNLYLLGFYKQLSDATNDINDWLSIYNVQLDEPLREYSSTFGSAFDKEIEVDEGVVMIRGFALDKECVKKWME